MDPLISVIVPVYNVEDYLDRCVESIVDQTYKNLEIILVDDGSTDSSGNKCDEWKMKENRITVIHKENGGLSDARNAGLEIAKGELIGFVDSDDFINLNMYQILYDTMIKTDSQIVEGKTLLFHDEREIPSNQELSEASINVFSTEDALLELIKERKLHQTVWNKLYQRDIIRELFRVRKTNEDEYWTYLIIGAAKQIASIDINLYYYFQRPTSIMHVAYSPKRLDGVFARKERMEYMKLHYPELVDVACLSFLWACFYHYQVICRTRDFDNDSHYRKMLHQEYRNNFSYAAVRIQPLKQRIWMAGFRFFPKITCRIRNLLKIGI